MSVYIDADAFARWEKGQFDLPAWLEARGDELAAFPATVWQQLVFGAFAWQPERAAKRTRSLLLMGGPSSNSKQSDSPISKLLQLHWWTGPICSLLTAPISAACLA